MTTVAVIEKIAPITIIKKQLPVMYKSKDPKYGITKPLTPTIKMLTELYGTLSFPAAKSIPDIFQLSSLPPCITPYTI